MKPAFRAAHVLVVDDEKEFCEFLRSLLSSAGHKVSVANDGAQAVKRFRDKPADIILMDLFMPKKEGLEAIGELVRDWPGTKIIAMTASRDEAVLKVARYLGAGKCLYKPFENSQLLNSIQELLTRDSST